MLFEQIDPCAGRFRLSADGRRHGDPLALLLAEIFHCCSSLAVFLGEVVDDIVDRFEVVGIAGRVPGREGEDVVPAMRLRFGRYRQQVLVAL
jgi:hypothetical protein